MTSCRHCDHQFHLGLDTGLVYYPLEQAVRLTTGRVRRTLQEIIAQHRIVSAEYGHRLLACPTCESLHERFYVRVDYEADRKLYQSHVYETTFRCGRCRAQLQEPDRPANHYRCAACGRYSLEDGPADASD